MSVLVPKVRYLVWFMLVCTNLLYYCILRNYSITTASVFVFIKPDTADNFKKDVKVIYPLGSCVFFFLLYFLYTHCISAVHWPLILPRHILIACR